MPIFQNLSKDGHISPDIIAVGLQEMISLSAMNMIYGENPQKMQEWETLLENAIIDSTKDEGYIRLTSKSMVGCYLGIFIQSKLVSLVGDVLVSKIKTGAWGSTGNKGAVVGRLRIDDTSILFMNCHLMSGNNKGKLRIDEINYIFDNVFKDEGLNRVSFSLFV
jgi:hypothetical protein